MNNFNNKYHNNIHKSFSPYGGKSSSINEQQEALEFAKKLRDKHIQDLKNFNTSKDIKKDLQKQKELDKKYEEQKIEREKQRIEKIKNMSNEEIKRSLEIAKEQNKKFKDQLNEDSSIDDLFNTLSEDLKNYQK